MKSSFIKMVNKHRDGNYPMDWFYSYYISKTNNKLDPNIFSQIFMTRDLKSVLEHVSNELSVGLVYKGDSIVAAFEL